MSEEGPLAFATRPYLALGAEIRRLGGLGAGSAEVRTFPDGERYQRIRDPVAGRDVALVGGTVSDEATLELFDLACGLVQAGARSLSLVIPYFGHSTMERAAKPGEVVTAKTRALLLSAIPRARAGNRVLLLDLHSEGLPYYFEGGLSTVHVYAKPVVLEAARRLGGPDFVLASTDAGRAKWVQSLADDLGVPASFVFKKRLDGERTELAAVNAHVFGRPVVLYDDMIRTGSSLLTAGGAYREAGATRITVIATHGLFPGNALGRLKASGLFAGIVCTDSHPRAVELQDDFLSVVSIAGLLAAALREG